MKKLQTRAVFFVALGLSLFCLLAVAIVIGYVYLQRQSTPQQPAVAQALPSVLFTSPQSGEEVTVGDVVPVHAVARGSARIGRVELWIDGQLQAAQDSALPGGSSPFPLVHFWQPLTPGPYTMIARAFDVDGAQAQAVVDLMVTGDDRDGDGVADELDACPDEPGLPPAAGCPDRDGDGVADSDDACPDEPGAGVDGCPAPASDDRDGDGIPDAEDACPDVPGIPMDGCPLIGDRDGDGVPDAEDACPDVPGSPETAGCPDRDGDGVPDAEDTCPDEPGPFADGCPAPSDGDRDGDGFPDGEDRCPDEPGVPEAWGCPDRDRDGVPDSEDDCPDEWGLPENRGCPVPGSAGLSGDVDTDGDGIPDSEDACPGTPGPPELEGCPDSDGDGIPDHQDMCPDEPGLPENLGCPEGTTDRDGDGVPDAVDLCPDEPGQPEDGGCPPPTEEDEPEGEVFGDIEGLDDRVLVEFQALSFQVGHDYDGVYCYPRLGIEPVERYRFEPSGGQQWDIATPLGSRRLLTEPDRPIAVQVECGGDVVFTDTGSDPLSGSGWGVYWRLGAIDASHPPSDWDGHVITARSGGGEEGRWFEAQYRLCAGSCDETAFPPPRLHFMTSGGRRLLSWAWDGDVALLAGYSVYANGTRIRSSSSTSNFGTMDISDYAPLCGGQLDFAVIAYGADGRESPPSNMMTWAADACPRVVRVTFDELLVWNVTDEDNRCLGPIFGSFWVEGSASRSLSFEGADGLRGFRLCPDSRYDIQEMFDTIWGWGSGMGGRSSRYRAPDTSSVSVELGPDDDLTIGGAIYEWDRSGLQYVYRRAFLGSASVPADQVRPGRHVLVDGPIHLYYSIDVLVGPEVGAEPDLTITDVDRHEASGQLRIHVFNNAADMAAPADVAVHWVRVGSSAIVGSQTWQNVQIPSGGSRILQLSDPVDEIGGMLFTVDPDLVIPDANRGNNTFETPVRIRVEFLQLQVPDHVCEGFLDREGELHFRFRVGLGSSQDEASWLDRRYPESDYYELDMSVWGEEPAHWRTPWRVERAERYTFELEMSRNENLYIQIAGYEHDPTREQPMGRIEVEYGPFVNYGDSPDEYSARSTGLGTEACEEYHPIGVEYFGFRAWWRITRVE
jgi:hypothetical protein